MDIVTQPLDTLDIALVKQHLYVDFATDDALIQHHINASLVLVENYLGIKVLDVTYESVTGELEEFTPGMLKLSLPYKPIAIMVTDDMGVKAYTERDDFYEYDNTGRFLYVPYTDTNITSVMAGCGEEKSEAVDQARLLIIGNWYAFRENDVVGSAKALPTGAVFLLDSLEGASL